MRSLCSCPPIPDFWADSRECQGFNEVKGKLKVFSETFCHLSINIQMLECSASFPWNSCHCWDNKTSSILKHIPALNPLWKTELFLRCLVWKQSSGKIFLSSVSHDQPQGDPRKFPAFPQLPRAKRRSHSLDSRVSEVFSNRIGSVIL